MSTGRMPYTMHLKALLEIVDIILESVEQFGKALYDRTKYNSDFFLISNCVNNRIIAYLYLFYILFRP